MSDQSNPLADFPERDDDPPAIRQMRDALKREQARASQAEANAASNAELARENAFLKAGVDLESPVGKMFTRAYDGELDADAIKAEAAQVGALLDRSDQPTTTPGATSVTPDDIRQTQERQALANDGVPPGLVDDGSDVDPLDEGYRRYHERLAAGARREDAAAEVIDRIIDAAARGDERVLYDPQRWAAEQARAQA